MKLRKAEENGMKERKKGKAMPIILIEDLRMKMILFGTHVQKPNEI
jgi:hypothetical protein